MYSLEEEVENFCLLAITNDKGDDVSFFGVPPPLFGRREETLEKDTHHQHRRQQQQQ